jgi:hypothetical protein
MRPMFGSPGRWIYLFRAVDSGGATLDFYLSENRDDGGCQALPRQVLAAANHPRPRLINVDGNPSYPHAVGRLKQEGRLGRRCRHDGAPQPSLFQHPRYSLTIFNAASSPHTLFARGQSGRDDRRDSLHQLRPPDLQRLGSRRRSRVLTGRTRPQDGALSYTGSDARLIRIAARPWDRQTLRAGRGPTRL